MKKHLLALLAFVAFGMVSAFAEELPEVTVEINPANGSQLTELSSFQLTFSTEMTTDWPESVEVYRNGVYECGVTMKIASDSKTVTYTLAKPQTQDGTYSIRHLDWSVLPINADLFTPYIELTYYIGEPQELEPIVSTSPVQERLLTSLSEVSIGFENVKTLEINHEKSVVMTNGEVTYPYTLSDESGQGFMLVLASPVDEELNITKGGEYKLIIEDGALVLNGKEYGYTFTFTISESLSIVSVSPAEGVVTIPELENIDITFNKDIITLTGYMMQGLQLRQLDEDDNPIAIVADYKATIDAENPKLVHLQAIDGVDIDETGKYSLNVPPTLFVSSTDKNVAFTIEYEVTSLDGLSALIGDSDGIDVYTISGIKVIDNGSRESVRSLAPGLYIIGGKKVVIGKRK